MNEFYWKKAINQTTRAIESKALNQLSTNLDIIVEDNINYEIRSLKHRFKSNIRQIGPRINPFSPWDKELEIDLINDKHVLILNKYPIQIGHMLLITKQWSPQNGWLNISDWTALVEVNTDTTGLWFFNSCYASGASQPHRHIQLLPRNKNQINCPRDNWLRSRIGNSNVHSDIERSTIVYSFSSTEKHSRINELEYLYNKGCDELQIGNPKINSHPLIPYNLLITNDYIALIKRSTEFFKGFSVNALGFAGYLLATPDSDLAWLKSANIKFLLTQVIYQE